MIILVTYDVLINNIIIALHYLLLGNYMEKYKAVE